jgi:hypothetical protein
VLALTVRQPWAGLIVLGVKDVENRTWLPPDDLIGERLAIHAAASWYEGPWPEVDTSHDLCHARGYVLGSVRLVDVVRDSTSRWAGRGHYHWLLDEPRRLRRPRYVRGSLGLWELS